MRGHDGNRNDEADGLNACGREITDQGIVVYDA